VYATAETDKVIREIDRSKRDFWATIYPDDYPPVTTVPTELVNDGETVDIAGLQFTVRVIGAGESATGAVWVTAEIAFVGDLVYSNMHPWLFEGRTYAWLEQIDRARSHVQGKRLYVGHGNGGDIRLLDEQVRYIRAYQAAIRELSKGRASLDDTAKKALSERMENVWPGAALGNLIAMSADPVAAELAAQPGEAAAEG
jgi:glyoxylase-like metal-dependent hydrolase (beta-lactamase superfamily II)